MIKKNIIKTINNILQSILRILFLPSTRQVKYCLWCFRNSTIMGNTWSEEALLEHNRVYESLATFGKWLDTNDFRAVQTAVSAVVDRHLRADIKPSPISYISAEIMKHLGGVVKFNFIVIVTDQKINDQLSKIPIFVIQFGTQTFYIDTNCFISKSWEACLDTCTKTLPSCKFSFPREGYYTDEVKGNIVFQPCIQPKIICSVVWKWGLGIAGVAATWFLNISSPMIGWGTKIMKLTKMLFPNLNLKFVTRMLGIMSHVANIKSGRPKDMIEGSCNIFRELMSLHQEYKEELEQIGKHAKQTFSDFWSCLQTWSLKIFGSLRSTALLRSLAVLCNYDKIHQPLLQLKRISDDETCTITQSNSGMNSLRKHNITSSEIFGNCRNESVFYHNYKEKPLSGIAQFTQSSISVVTHIVDQLSEMQHEFDLTPNDMADIVVIVQSLIVEEYKSSLSFYNKSCEAASKNCDTFNLSTFNRDLGIIGNPSNHFWLEAEVKVKQSEHAKFVIAKKLMEEKEKTPVHLIQCMEVPNNKVMGLYRCIGFRKGFVDTSEFVQALKEIIYLDEDRLTYKEQTVGQSREIIILTNYYSVWIYQRFTEEGRAEGMITILENSAFTVSL